MTKSVPTKNATRRKTAIYREAARLIESGEASTERVGGVRACHAIDQAAGRKYTGYASRYVKVMLGGIGMTSALYHGYEDKAEANDERIIALCFMAALVEAGDA